MSDYQNQQRHQNRSLETLVPEHAKPQKLQTEAQTAQRITHTTSALLLSTHMSWLQMSMKN